MTHFQKLAVNFSISLILGGIALVFANSCTKTDTPAITEFAIMVDSIVYSDTIAMDATLNIKYYGTIGPNSCYSFQRFDVAFVGDTIGTTAVGGVIDSENCFEEVQILDGETAKIYNMPKGKFIIVVNQPDGSHIMKPVVVL